MPQKNSIKTYCENAYYHIYNRGVEKRTIFQDEKDYTVFLHFLKKYLLPIEENTELPFKKRHKTFLGEIDLISYCLMPNHFHLLLKQVTINGITEFLRTIATNYAMYFNYRYKRIGTLFQGIFKGVSIETDEQLLEVSRYIHRNPLSLPEITPKNLASYSFSSYPDYLQNRNTVWVKRKEVLSFFSYKNKNLSYQSFVEHENFDSELTVASLAIDNL